MSLNRFIFAGRRTAVFLFSFLCLSLVLLTSSCVAGSHYVKHVIDGDTIVLENGATVRYLGINTPEIAHKNSPAEPYGREAAALNRRLVEHRRVILRTGSEKRDRFGRILAWVYLPDKRLVNEILVRKGLAHVCFYKKRDPVRPVLLRAQQQAIRQGLGIWSVPVKHRETYYVGNRRSLVLHRPWCRYGKRTSGRNRVVFYNRLDAYRKGYCRCKTCQP